MKKSGFTLIELLLVIAVIGILLGVLFSGVFSVSKEANEKRNANNAKLLEAAIMEYRHDIGKWPIPDEDVAHAQRGLTPEVTGSGELTQDPSKKRRGVYWTLTYGELDKDNRIAWKNNQDIVERLLNAEVGEKDTKKSYLDLRPFVTAADPGETRFPVDDTISAYEYWRDHGQTGKNMALLYRSEFIRCPVCGQLNFGTPTQCSNSAGCHDTTEDGEGSGSAHIFTKEEREGKKEIGGVPFKITFDFINNTCTVQR